MEPSDNGNTSGNIMHLHTVLVSRVGVPGDVVMAVHPLLYSVCRSYPEIKFVNDNNIVQPPPSCHACSITGDRPYFRHDHLCLTTLRPETILSKLQKTALTS